MRNIILLCILTLFTLTAAYAADEAASVYTTAAESDEYTTQVPYTDFTSLKPVFTEEPLDEDYIELSREDVEEVYREFKGTIVTPPYPAALASPDDYRIEDSVAAFERCAELARNINKLIFSVTDASLQEYGPFLQAMRDVVYLDAVCLKEYNSGKAAHRELWHSLHNKWLSAAEERYAALEKLTNE